MPDPITQVITTIAHAEPTLPGEVDRQRRQIKHHPAKNVGDGLRVREDRVCGEVRVCSRRV